MSAMEQTLLLHLEEGPDGAYTLSDPAAIAQALVRAVQGPAAKDEVIRTLCFAAALRGELESEDAADQLIDILRAEPFAFAIIANDVLDAASIDETRTFREQEGREVLNRAPQYGAEEIDGLQIRDFLDVAGGIGVPRVVRHSRKEEIHGRRSQQDDPGRATPEGERESDA